MQSPMRKISVQFTSQIEAACSSRKHEVHDKNAVGSSQDDFIQVLSLPSYAC